MALTPTPTSSLIAPNPNSNPNPNPNPNPNQVKLAWLARQDVALQSAKVLAVLAPVAATRVGATQRPGTVPSPTWTLPPQPVAATVQVTLPPLPTSPTSPAPQQPAPQQPAPPLAPPSAATADNAKLAWLKKQGVEYGGMVTTSASPATPPSPRLPNLAAPPPPAPPPTAPPPPAAGPVTGPAAAVVAPLARGNGVDLPPWAEELLDLATACNQGVGYACDALQSEDLEKLEWLATRDVVTQPVGGAPAPVAGLDVIKRLRGGWRVVRGQGRYAPARAVPSRGGRVAAVAASTTEEEAAARLAWLAKQGVPAWGYVGRAFTEGDDLPSPAPPAGASREELAKMAWLSNQGKDSKQGAPSPASAAAAAKASFLAKRSARNALSQGAAAKAAWLSEQEVPWWELALSKKFEHGSSM